MSLFNTLPSKQDSCELHGAFESKHVFGDIWARCPKCTEIEAEKSKREREEEEHKDWLQRLRRCGVAERFWDRTLENYAAESPGQRAALEFAVEFVTNLDDVLKTGRSAIFVGRPGTGKTHLAVGILKAVLQQDWRTGLFTTVQRAIRRIKDSWSKTSDESEGDAIQALSVPDLLVLDEVGVQFGSEFEKNTLFDVLNERYERRKPTLMLSNLDAKEVAGFLGERIMDRLREDGGRVIVFNWDSFRKRG